MKEADNNITFLDLYEKIKDNIRDTEELLKIKEAYNYAFELHKGMKRLNGDDFITHPLYVTDIVNDLNVDATTIIAALLHEVMVTNDVSFETLKEKFGEDVAIIVESVTKINKLELTDDSESSAIYLRKVLVGLATDVRVLFIKLADRLHNMRTNYAINPKKQKQKAYETKAVLIPIAHRLGINSIKSELENLCLYYTKPDVYNDILEKLNETQKELNDTLEEMKANITSILTEQGLKFQIKGRVKSVHSIYNKLNTGRNWNDIYDILAIRVILDNVDDCYMAVGLVHSKYRPIPKRFKDYIAMPKANMYQSLHTTVYGANGHLFEVQFRTFEMDEFAEKGMASHWSYKEKGTKKVQHIMEQKLEMFRNLIETHENVDDIEFEAEVKNDMLAEMIYVYTPKGDVIELPKGATPVDFAYRIHSDVGDKTVGAIVNDVIVPLNYELNNNDIVKINTNINATPNKDWLGFIKTSQAKNKIKAYFSKQERVFLIEKGKDILEKELRKRKLAFNEVMNDTNIIKITKELKLNDLEDIYLAIGTIRFTAGYIISLTNETHDTVEDALMEKVNTGHLDKDYKNDVIVAGIPDLLVNIAKCCKPVKGDQIIGYITRGDGITVHKKDCANVINEQERIIDVAWNDDNETSYYTDIVIEALNNKNYLSEIIATFTKRNICIDSFKTKEYTDGYSYQLSVKVDSKDSLDKVIVDLENLTFIKSVRRC
ncbi:MAG: bifunctional (p)ppGpp synthetase/guanosine-3',5'-bis(diphosphate) 3'-pyrophosphohydrolase [Bacilli bacterium]|jgi:guanosine-3',5'-bis(diphosphate) 3'-pyrophosphohydrolase|nr:bifunctional (p)ppGpp synthetase/guanosine-3',5'-bis(diphosphate) 3'-pyrophosphohydrolase [Bacilli bacterium]